MGFDMSKFIRRELGLGMHVFMYRDRCHLDDIFIPCIRHAVPGQSSRNPSFSLLPPSFLPLLSPIPSHTLWFGPGIEVVITRISESWSLQQTYHIGAKEALAIFGLSI